MITSRKQPRDVKIRFAFAGSSDPALPILLKVGAHFCDTNTHFKTLLTIHTLEQANCALLTAFTTRKKTFPWLMWG